MITDGQTEIIKKLIRTRVKERNQFLATVSQLIASLSPPIQHKENKDLMQRIVKYQRIIFDLVFQIISEGYDLESLNSKNDIDKSEKIKITLDEVVSYLESRSPMIFNDVNAPRDFRTGYKDTIEKIYRKFKDNGSIRVELGSWTAWPTERVKQVCKEDGLSEFIRLDINLNFFPDVVADCASLPFRDNSVDIVSSNSLFEHIVYPHETIKESFRILRPGGVMYIKVPFHFTEHACPYDYLRYTPQFFEKVCNAVGFETVFTDNYHSGGIYYTLHQLAKATTVKKDLSQGEQTTFQLLHALLLIFLSVLSPLDRFFLGEGRNLYHAVECIAVKPGNFKPLPKRSFRKKTFILRNLKRLVCPKDKSELSQSKHNLQCKECKAIYPIKSGIPIFV